MCSTFSGVTRSAALCLVLASVLSAQGVRRAGASIPSPKAGAGWVGFTVITQPDDNDPTPFPIVVSVEPGSPAQVGGLVAGDTIVDISGVDARNNDGILSTLRDLKPGQRVVVHYRRNGTREAQLKSIAVPRQYANQERVTYTIQPGDFPIPHFFPNVGSFAPALCDELPFAGAQIKPLNADLADALGVQNAGVMILSITPGTPANKSGLRPGDIIVKADSVAVDNSDSIVRAMREASDRSVMLGIVRKGRAQRIPLKW